MAQPDPTKVRTFLGLNNTNDTLELGLSWLRVADNVDITANGKVERRDGYGTRALAAVPSGAFTSADYSCMYLVDAGTLKAVNADMSTVILKTGLATAPMYWAELNKQVFFSNGIDSGIIRADGVVMDWAWAVPSAVNLAAVDGTLPAGQYRVACTYLLADGRETGAGPATQITLTAGQALQLSGIPQVAGLRTLVYIAPANSQVYGFAFATTLSAAVWNSQPDQLGVELATFNRYPLPAGAILPTVAGGRMCVALYMPSKDQSVVFMADALAPHLFSLDALFFMVPGEVVMLACADDTLIVGTRSKIYSYLNGARDELAGYGCIPGYSWANDGPEKVFFWSTRGLCSALPFKNHTENNVSVAPGQRVGVALLQREGGKTFVACLQSGGTPFNAHP